MCTRSKAEVGPSARTREGGTTRALAGSVRYDEIHYTRSRDRAYSAVNRRHVGIEDVLIDFGDGTTSDVGGATGSLPPIQHVYQNGGTFTVRVTVTDSTGTVTTGTTVVTIS